jgi:hypothetical protein
VFLNYRKSERSPKIMKLVRASCYHMYRLCASIEKILSKLGCRMPKTQTSLVCYHINHMWRCLGFSHLTSQLALNLLNCCTQPLQVIARHPDKFRDFRTSFGFFCNLETLFPQVVHHVIITKCSIFHVNNWIWPQYTSNVMNTIF